MHVRNLSARFCITFVCLYGSSALAQTQSATTPVTAGSRSSGPPPAVAGPEKATALDPSVQMPQNDDTIPSVYKDMVVVQRKAKEKAKHFLFSTFGTLDFQDGPITNYAINTNIGYAFSDYWEFYLNLVPAFVTVERPLVGKVRALTLANGQQATITYAKPTLQYGAELMWLPAYGKESWGPYSIVRSDTFFKFGMANINYESGYTGLRGSVMAGKTYFVKNLVNIRAAAGVAYSQSVVDGQKNGNWAPALELGLVFYF